MRCGRSVDIAERLVARERRPFAGHEVDLTVSYEWKKNFKVQAGYSHFFAGDYLSDTGPSDDADFGYLMTSISY